MEANKTYIYDLLTHNSKYYWKFLISYGILILMLFSLLSFCEVLSVSALIISLIYIISLWILTVWITVAFLRKLFNKNELFNWKILASEKMDPICTDSNENTINKLCEDIVNQFVKIWYESISTDKQFCNESRIILESSLNLLMESVISIDKKHFIYAIANIFLKHLKEFHRTLKLKEKNGERIDELYRYSFNPINNNNICDYYVHQMTNKLLVNFIHWDLWNSIPCKLVVSILSNKLSYLIDLCSNPEFLNYYLLVLSLPKEQAYELKLFQYTDIKLDLFDIGMSDMFEENMDQKELQGERKSAILSRSIVENHTDHGNPQKVHSIKQEFENKKVKVYEPRSSNEKWSGTLDLTSVSLGEDPLESPSQTKNIIEGIDALKDVKNDTDRNSGIAKRMNCNKTILEEMKHMTSMDGFKSTMKPFSDATASTLRDIKDFQENTVNTVVKPVSHATSQALHKIGDFQDEAAGMVEGLFDLGMAGIRKGLKLTGLQENSANEGMISEGKNKSSVVSPSVTNKKAKAQSNIQVAEECVWINPLQPNIDNDVLGDTDEIDHIPSILMDNSEYGSPDPEYEEGADFATTIAKLRSLLQQKSSESTSTTPVASPMVSDSNKSLLDLEEVDGFIPSIYKVCAKTATGVFNNTLNTIKTALPVTDEEVVTYGIEKWEFQSVEDKGVCLMTRMNKLLQERKDFCMVETAYDAFDSQEPQGKKFISDVFLDETDDFESKVPLARTVTDIICELIADSDSLISQEPFIKFLLLVFGKSIDESIISNCNKVFNSVCLTEVPKSLDRKVLTMKFDEYLKYLTSVLPDAVNLLASHSTLNDALRSLILSIQMKKCNKDVIFQIFEFLVLRMIEDGTKKNI